MKKTLMLAAACVLSISGVTLGSIVYSGSQNVTLALSPMSPMDSRTIEIGGMSGNWDDFRVDLGLEMGMPGMMGMGTRLVIFAPGIMGHGGMGMGGIVGIGDLASNLTLGAMIGPNSSLTGDGWALLTGSGEFHEEGGYIGLMMDSPFDGAHYGWLHMSGQSAIGTDTHNVTFDGWAYETQPDAPVGAGVVPVPGAVCLGLLGVGLVGLVRERRRLRI